MHHALEAFNNLVLRALQMFRVRQAIRFYNIEHILYGAMLEAMTGSTSGIQ